MVELAFLSANLDKIVHGGWFPLAIGAWLFAVMTTWKTGRTRLRAKTQNSLMPLDPFLTDIERHAPHRVAGTAIFLTNGLEGTPLSLLHNLKYNKVVHERNILLTIVIEHAPRVKASRRTEIESLGHGFWRVVGRYGFMEGPNVPHLLAVAHIDGATIDPVEATYFLSRANIIPAKVPALIGWRSRLFALMVGNAQFRHLPLPSATRPRGRAGDAGCTVVIILMAS